jgi:hypothetical protein
MQKEIIIVPQEGENLIAHENEAAIDGISMQLVGG